MQWQNGPQDCRAPMAWALRTTSMTRTGTQLTSARTTITWDGGCVENVNQSTIEGETQSFLRRLISNCGNYLELKLSNGYIESVLKEADMANCSPATTPGTSTNKHTSEDSESLSIEKHRAYKRMVAKLQWLTYRSPNIAYSTKELARGLQQPTTHHWKKVKHLLR